MMGAKRTMFFMAAATSGLSFGLAPTATAASFLPFRRGTLSRNQFSLTSFPAMHQPAYTRASYASKKSPSFPCTSFRSNRSAFVFSAIHSA